MPLPRPPARAAIRTRHRLAAGLLVILVASGGSSEARSPRGAIVSLIAGECRWLIVANQVVTRDCRPRLIGIRYPTREISFVFTLSDGRLVSFKGRPGHSLQSQTTLKVGQVTTVSRTAIRPSAVLGSCVFTGIGGRRNALQCEASGAGTRYAASFLTRGDVPLRFAL